MAKLDKAERLDLEVFGRRLIESGDLDPVYNALVAVKWDGDAQLRRWLLAYWCCYHAGMASWLSERTGERFWEAMTEFAANASVSPLGGETRWPRGRERRHFRGAKCITSVVWMRGHFSAPEAPVWALEKFALDYTLNHGGKPVPYQLIKNAVTVWPLFGPWIAFKVGDMLERLLGIPIDFTDSGITLYDSPAKAAEMWMQKIGGIAHSHTQVVGHAVYHLQSALADMKAPPSGDRPLGLQEFETILCKWKAHQDGIYPVGIDTEELDHALEPWCRVSQTADQMVHEVWRLQAGREYDNAHR